MNNVTKKSLHLVKKHPLVIKNEMDEITGFIHSKPEVRVPFNVAIHSTLNATFQFHPVWETSTFLDEFMPAGVDYIELTVELGAKVDEQNAENIRWMEKIVRSGFLVRGTTYRVIYGVVDGSNARAYMVPEGSIKSLKSLGLTQMLRKQQDIGKVMKYTRRCMAKHVWHVAGNILGKYKAQHGTALTIEVDGVAPFNVLHTDLEDLATKYDLALADGMSLLDINLARELGRILNIKELKHAKEGDAFKGTVLASLGMGKGFFHIVNMSKNKNIDGEFGIVLFGAKKQVSFERFFMGSLGDVKGGEAYTDSQSLVNFLRGNMQMYVDQAEVFFRQVLESIHDEEKLRGLVLRHMGPIGDNIFKQEEGGREAYVLYEAMRHGVPCTPIHPGLNRKVINFLFERVVDATRGRVPYQEAAARFNVMPDPNVFYNEEGVIDGSVDYKRSSLGEDVVCCMDLKQGSFFMHRQPSGHSREGVFCTNVHDRRFRKYRGQNRVILGFMAWAYLRQMGGGDMDDAVIATDNLELIKSMSTVTYPDGEIFDFGEKANVVEENKWKEMLPKTSQQVFPRNWSVQVDFMNALATALERITNLGTVVNAVMMDVLLSGDDKEHMLTYIADLIADKGADATAFSRMERQEDGTYLTVLYSYGEVYDWLRARPDNILKEVAWNLEYFIDLSVMGKGEAEAIAPLLKLVEDVLYNSLVVPASFLITDKEGKARLSAGRRAKADFIAAPSLVCGGLLEVAKQVDLIQEALTEEHWLSVECIPDTMQELFPRNREFREEAMQLREEWRDAMAPKPFEVRSADDTKKLYKEVIKTVVKPAIAPWQADRDIMMGIAVEHARMTYKGRKTQPRRDENGKMMNYPDALLWTNEIGGWYIQALKDAELTGLYVPVTFDRHSNQFARGEHNVTVDAAGMVYLAEDGKLLGYTMDPEGEVPQGNNVYAMRDGLIVVAEASPELGGRGNAVDADEVFEDSDASYLVDLDDEDVFAATL